MKRALFLTLLFPILLMADHISIPMSVYSSTDPENGISIGQVLIEDSSFGGVLVTPALESLLTGVHGFHVHAMPSCAPMDKNGEHVIAGSAGGHLDPKQTNKHEGPYGAGHLGDLPILVVNADGFATTPSLAPRVKVSDLHGHSLMIHMGGDNYSDTPTANGGGGDRIACGVIE